MNPFRNLAEDESTGKEIDAEADGYPEPFTAATCWPAQEQPGRHAGYTHSYNMLNIDLSPFCTVLLVRLLI
jgi:hypothetical protein